LFGLSWWILALNLFASPAIVTAEGDTVGDTVELIRLHRIATSPLYAAEQACRACELPDEEETLMRTGMGDLPMIPQAGKGSKRIEV